VTFLGMALITAVATVVLAAFAIVAARYARNAFREQSREVAAIEQQVKDGQAVTRQQAELLKVQFEQLDLQRRQLEDQQATNAEQAKVLRLQAVELQESLDERKRQAERKHSYQARLVFLTLERFGGRRSGQGAGQIRGIGTKPPSVSAAAHNTSDQPIYGAAFRWHLGSAGHGDPNPEPIGTILPGDTHTSTRDFPPGTNLEASGAVLSFRDAAGARWMRRPDGGLTEQE
jgi:hypothetical protein